MDSFEINKLLGAILGTAFMVFSIGLVSDALFASPIPAKPGFAVEAAADETANAGGAGAAAAPELVGPLLASADVGAGQAIFKKCQACHDGTKGGPNKVGPNLWGVVNRPIASHEGFSYSAGMTDYSDNHKNVWEYERINRFITAPKAEVKGTAMGFGGLKKIEDRADVIAYLRTLADTPPPLPAATPAAATTSAPAGDKTVPIKEAPVGTKAPQGG